MWSFVKSNDKKTQIEFNDEFKELNNSIKRTIINSPALLIFFSDMPRSCIFISS